MSPVEKCLAERECERLVVAYCHFVDHGEASKIATLFTDDGEWITPQQTWRGRAEILQGFTAREQNRERMSRHVCSTVLIDVIDEHHARGVAYFTLWRHDGEDGRAVSPIDRPAAIGEYRDEFVRTESGWRFSRRDARVAFVSET